MLEFEEEENTLFEEIRKRCDKARNVDVAARHFTLSPHSTLLSLHRHIEHKHYNITIAIQQSQQLLTMSDSTLLITLESNDMSLISNDTTLPASPSCSEDCDVTTLPSSSSSQEQQHPLTVESYTNLIGDDDENDTGKRLAPDH